MREDFEERLSPSKRNLEEEMLGREASVEAALEQSLDTLRKGYSWVGHLESHHPDYEIVSFPEIPWTPLEVNLSEASVALVSTAGVYLKSQKGFSITPGEMTDFLQKHRFRIKGDPGFRSIPSSADARDLEIAHANLDTRGAQDDINVVFPLALLRELEDENFIGELARRHISFMGYLPDPSELSDHLPAAISMLAEDGVDIVLLTPGEVLSHQSMAIIQREIEKAGMVTICITLCRDLTDQIGVPRAVHYRFPFGFTLGDANDQATQLRILKDTLRALEEIQEPGTILELPYEWIEG